MRLSRNAHYAIRTVIDLALRDRGVSAEIARRQGIPQPYMAKIVHGLSKAGILRTYRGTRGGVELAKAAGAVTLREVVEATEGPIALNLCVVWGDCRCLQPCPLRATLARLQTVMEREMESVTIEQLAQRLPAGWPHVDEAVSGSSQ